MKKVKSFEEQLDLINRMGNTQGRIEVTSELIILCDKGINLLEAIKEIQKKNSKILSEIKNESK